MTSVSIDQPADLVPSPLASRGDAPAPLAGMLWMALAATLFAFMGVIVRLASARVPWAEVASARAIVGALVAISLARARGVSLAIHDRRLSWARSLCGTAAMLCGFYTMGAPAIALGDVVTLSSTSAIFIAILSPILLAERSGRRVWVATAISFAGVALVAGPTFHLNGHLATVATLGALFSALAMIWLRKLGRGAPGAAVKDSPEAIVAHFSVVAAFTTTALALPNLRAPDLVGGALLVATGLLGGLGQLAMTRAYAREKASRLGAVSYLGIVLTHALSVALLGEKPGLYEGIGAVLIIGSGLMIALLAMRDARVSVA